MLHILLLGALACPHGDTPAPLGALEGIDADLVFTVSDDGVGRLRTRLSFANTGDGPARASVFLGAPGERPPVVTRAALVGARDAKLADAEPARERWDAFVDALSQGVAAEDARGGRRRAGLHLSTTEQHDDTLVLDVAAACSVRAPTVVLEMLFDGDATRAGWRFALPAPFARATISVDAGGRDVVIDGRRTRTHTRTELDAFALGDEEMPFIVVVERPRAISARGIVTPLAPRAAAVSSTTEQGAPEADAGATEPETETNGAPAERAPVAPFSIAHLAMDLPDPLRETPPELRVVFVVDTSVSVGEAGVVRTLELVHAILDASPDDVGYSVVTSARRPALLVPPWKTKSERHVPMPVVENGSNLALALAMAERIASDAPAGSGRIIVLSDLMQKDGDGPRLNAAIRAPLQRVRATSVGHAPLVHVVALPYGLDETVRGLSYARVPLGHEDSLAFVVEGTGGVMLSTSGEADSDMPLARHLTAPTSLDDVTLRFDGVRLDESEALRAMHVRGSDGVLVENGSVPETLGAGEGLRAAFVLDGRVRALSVSGRLWGTPVDIPITSSSRARVLALAHVANIELAHELHDDEVRAAAYAGHFASRTTSFVDVPQWRPEEPEGLVLRGCGCSGWGSCASGHSGYVTCGGGSQFIDHLTAQALLDAMAERVAALCHVARVEVTAEIADHEILDVTVVEGGACVREAWWNVRLDKGTHDVAFDRHRVWSVKTKDSAQGAHDVPRTGDEELAHERDATEGASVDGWDAPADLEDRP
jgi:hypothetical protein